MKTVEETIEFLYRLAEMERLSESRANRDGDYVTALIRQVGAETCEGIISFIKGELNP